MLFPLFGAFLLTLPKGDLYPSSSGVSESGVCLSGGARRAPAAGGGGKTSGLVSG